MGTIYEMINAPPAEEYVRALTAIQRRVSERDRLLFRLHYHAPDRTVTAAQLAERANLSHHGTVNLRYGRLGRELCRQLGIEPELRPKDKYRYWSVWSRGWEDTLGHFKWRMLPQVAEALERLGWVPRSDDAEVCDEAAAVDEIMEGAVRHNTVTAYERDPNVRQLCLAEYGTACVICGFHFGLEYGPEAEGCIEVHHLRPLSEMGGIHRVNPVQDTRPVCPNCHAVVHLGGRCRSIEEVRNLRKAPKDTDRAFQNRRHQEFADISPAMRSEDTRRDIHD